MRPRIYTPGYLSLRNENLYSHKNSMQEFIAALFMIAKSWKQPRCPSIGKWLNTLWYVHTIRLVSNKKE